MQLNIFQPVRFYVITHNLITKNLLDLGFQYVLVFVAIYRMLIYLIHACKNKATSSGASHFSSLALLLFLSFSIFAFLPLIWCSALPWGVGPPVGGEQRKRPGRCSTTGLVLLWAYGRAHRKKSCTTTRLNLFFTYYGKYILCAKWTNTLTVGEEHYPPPLFHRPLRVTQEEPISWTLHGWHHSSGQHHRWGHCVSFPEGK